MTDTYTPSWKVKLEGRTSDLDSMSECFTDPSCQVRKEGPTDFYLVSTSFDSIVGSLYDYPSTSELSDAAYSVELAAGQLLGIVNGAFFLEFRVHEGMTLGRIIGEFGDGHPGIVVDHGTGNSQKMWLPDAPPPTQSSNPARWLECAINYPVVAEALTIYGSQTALTVERAHAAAH